MSTVREIKTAIDRLNPRDKALLTAELFATDVTPDETALELALRRGLKDVESGRVRAIEEVGPMISEWTLKS